MPIKIVKKDITAMECDAVVNIASKSVLSHKGVSGSIYRAAGLKLLFSCLKNPKCSIGEVKVTPAYKMPCQYLLHTVAPRWDGGDFDERNLLSQCFKNSLIVAKDLGCESVAFPLSFSDILKYPQEESLQIAIDSIGDFLQESDITAYIVIADKSDFLIDKHLYAELYDYLLDNYKGFPFDMEYAYNEQAYACIGRPTLLQRFKSTFEVRRYLKKRKRWEKLNSRIESRATVFHQRTRPSYRKRRGKLNYLRHRRKGQIQLPNLEDNSKVHNLRINDDAQITSINNYDYDLPPFSDENLEKKDKSHGYFSSYPHEYQDSDYCLDFIKSDLSEQKIQSVLDNELKNLDEGFSQSLLRMIDERGMKDSECYKKANVDRRLFSKIRSNPDYHPRKQTVIAFAIALELDLDETKEFMMKAGFAFSPSNKADVIVEFFIKQKIYDVYIINNALFKFDQSLLGE